jgi:4-diphosphocytidyl-2-C-methyl-D-erythritol kinase
VSEPLTDRAPAKLNLCLYVGGRRGDGLHEICSVFVPLDLADELRLEPGADKDEVICPGVRGRNLAEAAVGAFRERFGWDGPPVRVAIDKRIPVSGGLGGGSADAAATLRLLSKWSEREASAAELQELAMTLGSDVPSQLEPRPLLVTGAGEELEPIEPHSLHAVLLTSPRGLSTRRVYEQADSFGTRPDLAGIAPRLRAAWTAAHSPADLGELLHNDLQRAAMALEPRIGRALELLRGAGAAYALPSGSGPTVFGLFAGADEAAAARERLGGEWDGETILVKAAA